MAGVYAGGDIVTGAATVIEAMGAGRRAARSIRDYLRIRDYDVALSGEATPVAARFFGIDRRERNLRVSVSPRLRGRNIPQRQSSNVRRTSP